MEKTGTKKQVKKPVKPKGHYTTSPVDQKRDEKLTPMQEAFCVALVENNYQKKKSAMDAGCKESSAPQMATKWLKMVKVRKRIHQLQEEQLQAMCLSENRVLGELIKAYERATADGAHSSAIRALELQGKAIGMFTEKQVTLEEPLRDDRFLEAISGQAATVWEGGDDGE